MNESRSDDRKRVVTLKTCTVPYLCPLNYLIIMAIRFGAVDAKTFDELCTKTLPKTVPLVDWVHALQPVFPQFSTLVEVQLDKPTTRGSTSWALKNFTPAIGLKERFRPHDLRYGAAIEVNNLQDLPARNEFHTREALGHSWKAL
ncbi:hypothetical protein CGMCC3_g4041 [Colletotrichum fructicola]|uniref:Uncharacterized protein n=2 Tax=Colletotrichum gloeosporioides species complex TaxID=2707338 RepID=L2G4F9_COLFN|nr:uncharacterized protein CGMCC3_g4041 [Colletotrichum fructicola]KAF4479474.1 hypothetical protein CGGC5_v012188 [Colletotrichum fructicola Nara gc5]KAK1841002.1 hypothetical protein CCHR01_16374 [Colletotrichum chrysophilum]KAE9580225.1 hypothetical protein CGMCC3_g4041 [Colletotrichum fructicola]KAF4431915.1 hypothetical protein CFRS1_v012568 [Colletotrichum fructicola]KAF5491276.1 hypothetical protein CGCF413_v011136 [Colletotrichum fructicola]